MGLGTYPALASGSSIYSVATETTLYPGGILREMEIAQRFQWIFDNRPRDDGKAWTAKSLSREAGLSEAHVGMVMRGQIKSPSVETLRPLAEKAGVSLAWLATGQGTPESDDSARGPSTTESERPELQGIPGWADAVALAKHEHPHIPEWAWNAAGAMAPRDVPVVTVAMVAELARWNMLHTGSGPRAVQAKARHQAASAERKDLADQVAAGEVAMPRPPEERTKRGKRG